MKVALLDIQTDKKKRLKREFQGGYGLRLNMGNNLRTKILTKISQTSETPVIHFAYIASIAKQFGHEVTYDINNVGPNSDLVIINASLVAHSDEISFARKLTGEGKKVYFIGPLASGMPDIFIDLGFSAIVGEPEMAFMDIFKREVLSEGKIFSQENDCLDSLPFPDWDVFPYHNYNLLPKISKKPVFPVNGSRSCPYTCNYCPYLVMSNKYRKRTIENIIAEINYLKDRYKMQGIFFRDPVFTAQKEFIVKLSERIIKEKIEFEYMCETRIDCLDQEILDIMKKSGARGINVGIESFDLEIQKENQRKPIPIKKQEEIIRYAEKIGIKINGFFILGYPQDDIDSINKTIEYAKFLNPFTALFYVYTPLPGTKAFESMREKINLPWESFDGFTLVYDHDNLTTEEISKAIERAYSSYYFRPRYIFKYLKQKYLY